MKGTSKIYDKLPFAVSFSRKMNTTLTIKKAKRILGSTFYPRLAAIYQNVIQALTYANYGYIKNNATAELASQLIKRRDYHKRLGLKLKINEPKKNLFALKNFILPERVYRTDNLYITVSSRVYFGGQLAQPPSYNWPQHSKVWKIGQNRYILWNSGLSLMQNLKSCYANQVYEFIVRYQSNLFIKCQDSHNGNPYQSQKKSDWAEDLDQETIVTQFVLRSSNDRFDWVLSDVNGILQGQK